MDNVLDLFTVARQDLDDVEGNVYDNDLLLVPYNKLISHLNSFLMNVGAEIARKTVTFNSVVGTYYHVLPYDFFAMVEGALRSSDSQVPLEQVDKMDVDYAIDNSQSGTPSAFCITTTGPTTHIAAQYLYFNVIPDAVKTYRYYYWPRPTPLTTDQISTQAIPWMHLLDQALHEGLVFWCRNNMEYNAQVEAQMFQEAISKAVTVLSLRRLQTRDPKASMWEGMPRWR